jgi:hypothetical protein
MSGRWAPLTIKEGHILDTEIDESKIERDHITAR